MTGQELIDYLSTLSASMDSVQGTIISKDTVNLVLTELINNKNEIEHLRNYVMSEDQVKQIMKDTCHQMMEEQKRIFEINGALEAMQELEVKCNDAATLHEIFKLVTHYRTLIAENL